MCVCVCLFVCLSVGQVGVNIFLYNGVFDGALVFATLVLCLLGRALHLPLLTALLNCGRKEAIERRHMIVMWFAGTATAAGGACCLCSLQSLTTVVLYGDV